jgi:hypothetical protein
MVAMKLTLNPHTQNRRMRHPESSPNLSSVPPAAKKIREKLDYMHRNPVTRKLVEHPKDWPWSSWSFYAQRKAWLVRIDPVA